MSAIGGDGGNRRALESGRGLPAQAVARATGKVSQALAKLGAVAAPARVLSADTMERSRGFGPFGAAPRVPTPTAGARALEGLPETWVTIWARARELAPGLTDSVVSMGRAESAVAAVREALARLGEGQGVWARARTAAGEHSIGRIASRFLALRERLEGGLEAAGQAQSVGRSSSLAAVVRGLRGEAASVRQDIAWARELVPDVELGEAGVARSALERAEAEMRTAEYGLQGYSTQQELLAPPQGASPGRISEEELSRIGTGITEAPPPQGFWNIGTVGSGMDAAFGSDSYCQAATEAVDRVIGDSTSVRPLEGAELAAAIRDMGVPLENVDPNQLAAALSYVNTGASGAVAEFGRGAPQTLEEQRERLHMALRQFRCLAEHGPAQMDRSTAINMMWSAARIPGHAFEKMSDAEVLAAAQQTAAACNTPGSHEFKVGRHTVKLTIGGDGGVQSTSTRAPSAWSKVGRVAKIALTVASFIPGPVGLVARGIQAGITLVNTVRNGGSFLDFVAAGASFVGAGAAAVGRIARAVPNVARFATNAARVANSFAGAVRGVQGVQRGGLGGVISGAAGVANGLAGAIEGAGAASGSSLGSFASGASEVGRALGHVGAGVAAAENYVHANRALGDAREALQQARASGDIDAIRQAERQLAEAERGKRSAVLAGLATGGQIAGQTLSRNSAGQSEARAGQVPAQGRSAFQVGAEIFSRGMNTARGLNEGDLLAAGAEALGGLAAARQGTRPLQEERVIGPDGLPIVLRDQQGNPLIDEHGNRRYLTTHDFDFTNQASSVTDGLSDWRQAARAEGQAREAVDQAEQALGLARSSGNPEAIKDAEENLRQTRRGLVQAELGSTLALDNASTRFTGSVETLQNSRAADAHRTEQRAAIDAEIEGIKKTLSETREEIRNQRAIASDPNADPQRRLLAAKRVEKLGQAMSVMGQLLALPGTDPERLRQGHAVFRDHRDFVLTANLDIRDLASTGSSAAHSLQGSDSAMSQRSAGAAGIAVLSRNGTLSHLAAMTGISVERLQEFNARYGIDLRDTTHLPTGQRVLVPMDEVQPRITVPKLSSQDMLARQELGLPLNHLPEMEIRPGDSGAGQPFSNSSERPGLFDEGRALADGVRDVYNERLAALTRSIVDAGHGGPVAFLGTLPLHVLDETVNFSAGLTQGVLNSAEGVTQLVRHPVDTTLGVASLIDRAAQTTPAGRTLEFLAEASFGKYRTTEEALKAYRERMDPLSIGAAQYALVRDLTTVQFEQSLRLAREGRYSQALGVLYGENADVFVAGILGRGSRLARFGDAAEDADDLAHLRRLYGEGPESDSFSIVSGPRGAPSIIRQHHVFPQELRKFFEERGFVGDRDINKYCVRIEQSTHEAIHGGGNWMLARKEWEGEWNRRIQHDILKRERDIGRKLNFDEIMKIGLNLLEKDNLPTDFVPYKRKR